MLTDQTRAKIKKLKVYTKRIMQSNLCGDYLSAFKGSGLEFDQLRDYQHGDDVRFIDWNSSAKMHKIMIKRYIQERDRTVIVVLDISGSGNYGSGEELRTETAVQLAATLSFIAHLNKDKIGILMFTDQVEQWISPSRGNAHISSILETLHTHKPQHQGTSIEAALRFLVGLKKRNAVVFFISDWIDDMERYTSLLRVAGCQYDFIGVRLQDPCEIHMPDIGLLDVLDPETQNIVTVDTRGEQNKANKFLAYYYQQQKYLFNKNRIDLLNIPLGTPIMFSLVQFFTQRTRQHIRG